MKLRDWAYVVFIKALANQLGVLGEAQLALDLGQRVRRGRGQEVAGLGAAACSIAGLRVLALLLELVGDNVPAQLGAAGLPGVSEALRVGEADAEVAAFLLLVPV